MFGFGGGGGTTAVIGGVAGVAVGGAVVAAAYEAKHAKQELMDKYVDQEHKAEIENIYKDLQEHLSDYVSPNELNQYRKTNAELMVVSPAFPQVKEAFNAILAFQRQRTDAGVTGCSCLGRKMVTESDPKTVVCELLKAWLETKSEHLEVKHEEVEAYRNFCRALVASHGVFVERNRYSFLEMMAHVASHLDSLLQLRLRQRQDGAATIKQLHKEAYNFALNATKLLLLAPTTFEIPADMYSTDSLETLRKTAIGLDHDFEEHLREELKAYWNTDCGRIVRRILGSPHGISLCASMDGRPKNMLGRQVKAVINGATDLPEGFCLFPRAEVCLVREGRKSVHGRVTLDNAGIANQNGKEEWNEAFEFTVPNVDSVTMVMDVLGLGGFVFWQTEPISAAEVVEYAKQNRQVWLPLKSMSGDGSDGGSKQGLKPQLLVTFERPSVRKEIQAVREKWEGDHCKKAPDYSNSGLVSKKFGDAFLKAAAEVDGFMYFTDILVSECLELAQLLGDLGMVLSEDMIRPLLDEIQHRLLESHRVLNGLLNLVYERVTNNHRNRSWHLFSKSSPGVSPLAQDSNLKLQKLKVQTLEDIHKLRLLCCNSYDTAADVLSEAKAVVGELMGKLTDERTSARSSRFGLLPKSNVVDQITLSPPDKVMPTKQAGSALNLNSVSPPKSKGSDSPASSTRTGSSSTLPKELTSSTEACDEELQGAREKESIARFNDYLTNYPSHNDNIGLIEAEHPDRRELRQLEADPSRQSTKPEISHTNAPTAEAALPASLLERKLSIPPTPSQELNPATTQRPRQEVPVARRTACWKPLLRKK
jgi:hypothetical protein